VQAAKSRVRMKQAKWCSRMQVLGPWKMDLQSLTVIDSADACVMQYGLLQGPCRQSVSEKFPGVGNFSGDILRTRTQVELLPMIAAAIFVEFVTARRNLHS
jgi:hypothetical protein